MTIDKDKLEIRKATLDDVDFISEAIIEAEKSSTKNNGLAKTFMLSDDELKKYLVQILEEEEDGCELSLSSFLVAYYDGEPVATQAGWLEGCNEGRTSSFIKSNLLSFIIPYEHILHSKEIVEIGRDLQIPREMGAYQIEYGYTKPEYRGNGLKRILIMAHLEELIKHYPEVHKCQTHVFKNNEKSIKANEKAGFIVVKEFESIHPKTLDFFPDDTIMLLEKTF